MKLEAGRVTNALQVLRAHGFVVGYAAGKVTLTAPGNITPGARNKAMVLARKYRADILSDLAAEEAESRG